MLECWQEHPLDRPSFSLLRKKFSDLLMATTTDAYMELEVDEAKIYYTMGEEEKNLKERRDSLSSTNSDSSIKKDKGKKIEKPKWAQNSNPYISTPSTFKEDHILVEDEHYRACPVEHHEDPSDEVAGNGAMSADEEQLPSHVPLVGSLSVPAQPRAMPILLEDQMGIPLSFVPGEKPSHQQQPPAHQGVKKMRSNPYVDDPSTKQLLPEEGNARELHKLGSLTAELNQRLGVVNEENVTAL